MEDKTKREISAIHKEIDDLKDYLNGLPEKLKKCPAFDSYWDRLLMLEEELSAKKNLDLKESHAAV